MFLFGFDGVERSAFLIFSLMRNSAACGLSGPLACLFIYLNLEGQLPVITDHIHTHTYAYTNL